MRFELMYESFFKIIQGIPLPLQVVIIATMLGFIVTDAKIDKPLLQSMLVKINEKSFNAITVDGDTSTNDMVLLAATGKSNLAISSQNRNVDEFFLAVQQVMVDLAHQIVKDGEGAGKDSIEISSSADFIDFDKSVKFKLKLIFFIADTVSPPPTIDNNELFIVFDEILFAIELVPSAKFSFSK